MKFIISVFACCVTVALLPAYPLIRDLSMRDALYIQQQSVIQQYTKQNSTGQEITAPLQIYSYKIRENDMFQSVFSIAARTLIPYSTLISLNGIASSSIDIAGMELLIPTIPGIFVLAEPSNELDVMLYERFKDLITEKKRLTIEREGELYVFYFFPGERLTANEQMLFFQSLFVFPLHSYDITSLYGWRNHPVTTLPHFHTGIDIATTAGSPVYASRAGVVKDIGYDDMWGYFVLLNHENGYQTFYAHLSKIHCTEGQFLQRNDPVGAAGSSGISTGTHLHFEIRHNNKKLNPLTLLPAISGSKVRY